MQTVIRITAGISVGSSETTTMMTTISNHHSSVQTEGRSSERPFCESFFPPGRLYLCMTPRYSKKAQDKVHTVMHEFKRGKLKSGRSHKKVTSRKQAIAIGLSEARKRGAKVPPAKRRR
jgi:hypothetical protein